MLGAALLTPLLLPAIGWRGLFAVGAIPAAIAYVIRRSLHEPDAFADPGRRPPSPDLSLRLLATDAETVRRSLGMVVLCSVQNFGYYGVMIWLPNYLSARFGYGLAQSAAWTAVSVLGMGAGIAAFGQIADRVGRRPAFLAYMAGAAVSVLVYARLTAPEALLVGGAVMGFFVNGMLGGYGALISELYPTAARATAQNVLFNLGRAVGGFGPVAVGALAAAHGFETAVGLLAALYVLDIAALLCLIPERRSAALT